MSWQPAGHAVSPDTVGRLLKEDGYSLQGNAKTVEGKQHPDRDGQFRLINELVREFQAAGEPVISVDTKKKELVGNYRNGGREWQPRGEPERVEVHDFKGELGRAVPYGVYDLTRQRRLGERRHRRRHRPVRGRVDPPLVAENRPGRLPARHQAAHHRRRRGLQRQPAAAVEGRTGPARAKNSAWRSACPTSRRARRNGTGSSTGSSPRSP